MATINEITSGAGYVGNAALGGFAPIAIELDVKPIQQLAQYTYLYNKSQYDQRQKDTDQKIAEIAKLAPYDLMNGLRKDVDEVKKAKLELEKYSREYLSKVPTNPQEKLNQEIDFNTKKRDTLNLINSANERAIKYMVRLNAIQKNEGNLSAEGLLKQKQQLDREFDETNIFTPIKSLPDYKLQNVDIPKPVTQKYDVIDIGADQNYETKITVFNPASNAPLADATVFGLDRVYPQRGTPEYDKLSQPQKDQIDLQFTVQSPAKIWSDMAVPFNAVLMAKGADEKPLYFDENGVFNATKFENDNASNSVVMRAYNGLKNLDKYSRDKFAIISDPNGVLIDKGVSYKLPSNINANDFKAGFIDFSKGVTPSQLAQVGMFAQYPGDAVEKDVKQTNAKIQRTNAWLDYKAATQKAAKPVEVIEKPAQLFGQHIERLKLSFSQNGGKPIQVQGRAVDDKTRIAAKMGDTDVITYNPDGSYKVTDNHGKVKSSGTIENLAQGFIDAVKTIDTGGKDKDGTMAEGFQNKSENMFKQIWGTTSGRQIWDSWGGTQQKQSEQSTNTGTKEISRATLKGLVGKKGYEGYTEQDIIDYYKSNGYEVK